MHLFEAVAVCLAVGAAHGSAVNKRAAIDDCLKAASVPTLQPGTEDYQRDSTAFNTRVPYTPAVLAVPVTISQIQAAVKCGAQVGVKVTPKSGGHSYASLGFGGEDGHLVLQLDRMYNVTLNKETNVATIQPGARLGHVVTELYKQGGRAFSHGTCPGVGISGHVLHGGFGFSSHLHGLALDWIKSMQVVLADGSLVTASITENPDLFWALRGAGSNFGIVVSFEFNTFDAPKQTTKLQASLASWTQENVQANLEALEEWMTNSMPDGLNFRVSDYGDGPGIEALYYGDSDGAKDAIAPLLSKVGGTISNVTTMEWLVTQTEYAFESPIDLTTPYSHHEKFYSKSLTLKGLSGESAKGFGEYLFEQKKWMPSTDKRQWWFQLDMHGGESSMVTSGDHSTSSYAHRDKRFIIQFYDRVDPYTYPEYPEGGQSFLNNWVAATTNSLSKDDWGMYINYADTELDRETANRLYYGASLPRLRELKAKYDPKELFYSPLSIRPAVST